MGKARTAGRSRPTRNRSRHSRPLVFPAQRRAARRSGLRQGLQDAVKPSRPANRRLPRPVLWLVWLAGAALASVLIGFALGLARPREAGPQEAQ